MLLHPLYAELHYFRKLQAKLFYSFIDYVAAAACSKIFLKSGNGYFTVFSRYSLQKRISDNIHKNYKAAKNNHYLISFKAQQEIIPAMKYRGYKYCHHPAENCEIPLISRSLCSAVEIAHENAKNAMAWHR